MEYKVIRDDSYLEHHGILGMKWGVRKNPNVISNKEYRNEGQKIYKEEHAKLEKSNNLKGLYSEANAYAEKHHLDGDDGGGGSQKAGKEYMKKWDNIYSVEDSIDRQASINKSKRLVEKYGKMDAYYRKRQERSDKLHFAAGVSIIGAIPVTMLVLAMK